MLLGLPIFISIGLITIVQGYLLWSNVVAVFCLSMFLNLIQPDARRRWLMMPAVTAAALLVVKTLFLLFNHPSYYREMIVIFEALIAGVMGFIFLIVRDVTDERKPLADYSIEETIATIVAVIGLLAGLTDVEILHISVTGTLARLAIMTAAWFWGAGGATMIAVIAAILPSVVSVSLPRTLLIYAVSGILSGVFRSFGKIGIMLGFGLGSMALSFFALSVHDAIRGIWETGIAMMLFTLVPISFRNRIPYSLQLFLHGRSRPDDKWEDHVTQLTADRMTSLARVFDEISTTFADTEPAPDNEEGPNVGRVFQEISNSFCCRCALYQTCWEKEFYQTYRDFFTLFGLAETQGMISYDELPTTLRTRCIRPRELAVAVNGTLETARVSDYWEERIQESREILAEQMKGVSGVIKNLAREISLQTVVDWDLKEYLTEESVKQGLQLKEITPLIGEQGESYIKIKTDACIDRETCDIFLAPSVSRMLGANYEVSHRKCPHSGRGMCEFTLARRFNFKVDTGVAQLAKEDVSGDSFNIATLRDGREMIVLSDGMGVGRKAAQESKATVRLLEELFNTGYNQEVALKTVNAILLLRKQRESFSTVDLALINLYSGEVDFVKIGAGPTFLKRGSRVGLVTAESLPLGILEEVEVPAEKRVLLDGDLLIMATDGILDAGSSEENREQWLRMFLAETTERNPDRLAEMVVNAALGRSRGQPRDDMTVVCVRLENNTGKQNQSPGR